MKSFRGERQKQNVPVRVMLTILLLLTSVLLANYFPTAKEGDSQIQQTKWESSVVKQP
ncbi:MAG: hypothetical protein K9M55_04120 [Candidatus Marinimicrobia bacterium]|nr:hypothetical protein [Candidatus Neomarinimicrobiota bacterium]